MIVLSELSELCYPCREKGLRSPWNVAAILDIIPCFLIDMSVRLVHLDCRSIPTSAEVGMAAGSIEGYLFRDLDVLLGCLCMIRIFLLKR